MHRVAKLVAAAAARPSAAASFEPVAPARRGLPVGALLWHADAGGGPGARRARELHLLAHADAQHAERVADGRRPFAVVDVADAVVATRRPDARPQHVKR